MDYIQVLQMWDRIQDDEVIFNCETLGYPQAKMVAADFKLPFSSMLFVVNEGVKLDNDQVVKHIRVIEGVHYKMGRGFNVTCRELKESIEFKILESGEIEMIAIDTQAYGLVAIKTMSEEQSKKLLEPVHEKWLYNFIYDLIATIEYINTSDHVVTKHTTRKNNPDLALPKGKFETRIKIKHTKPSTTTHPTGHGTKHRYKYRVRGHWRTMQNGKTMWIKDHVRGGDGTIFIPKEYEL